MHEIWMKEALIQAKTALDKNEVPVGAVVVSSDGKLLAAAHNIKESDNNPCGHAEVLALQKTAKALGNWRLLGCTLYVTLEPCMMCVGAIIQSRLSKVVYGASDVKGGYVESLGKGFAVEGLNHRVNHMPGVLENESSALLKEFFKSRRKNKERKIKQT